MTYFRHLVEQELDRIYSDNTECGSYHEGYGLIQEEVDEFWDEAKRKPKKRDPEKALRELVQIAARAEQVASDLGLFSVKDLIALMDEQDEQEELQAA